MVRQVRNAHAHIYHTTKRAYGISISAATITRRFAWAMLLKHAHTIHLCTYSYYTYICSLFAAGQRDGADVLCLRMGACVKTTCCWTDDILADERKQNKQKNTNAKSTLLLVRGKSSRRG